MEILTLISGLIFLPLLASANPIDINHKWNLIPDGDGQMHLIDASPQVEEIEPLFNPEVDTAFLLFTRLNPTAAQRITWTSNSIAGSNFNRDHPVRFLIHGFNSGPSSGVNTSPTRSYLQIGDYNVIVVDWSIGANTLNYVTARNRVPQVADQVARFINFLTANGYTQNNNIIIAGHSLGAHVAGVAGKRTNGRINTIFGLDPAGPLFSTGAVNERFAAEDADYTEGIRTNAGNLGFAEPLAHADFYPNWGQSQPGCGVDISGSCAHSRAHEFFAESITSNRFIGIRCADYRQIQDRFCPGSVSATMGGDPWSHGIRGVYLVETNSNVPFARG